MLFFSFTGTLCPLNLSSTVPSSHPVARAIADALPGFFIYFIQIIRNGKDLPTPRAGKYRTCSPQNQTESALTGTTFHKVTPLPLLLPALL
jgi:hypothetical protein